MGGHDAAGRKKRGSYTNRHAAGSTAPEPIRSINLTGREDKRAVRALGSLIPRRRGKTNAHFVVCEGSPRVLEREDKRALRPMSLPSDFGREDKRALPAACIRLPHTGKTNAHFTPKGVKRALRALGSLPHKRLQQLLVR